MNKPEQFDNSAVLNELKKASGNNRIRIPSQISFDLNDRVCNIVVPLKFCTSPSPRQGLSQDHV